MLLMLAIVSVVIGAIAFWKYTLVKKAMAMGAKFAPPPAAVTTLIVQPQTWQPVLSAVGSLKAVQGVTVSTDLAGIVSQIAFESGTPVKKGALLVKLDTAQEEAQLRSAEAKLTLARTRPRAEARSDCEKGDRAIRMGCGAEPASPDGGGSGRDESARRAKTTRSAL